MTALIDSPILIMRRHGLLAVGGGVLAPAVVWLVSQATGVNLSVSLPGQPTMVIGLAMVAATALLAGLAVWGLLVVLEHFFAQARAIWTGAALVGLLASFGAPASVQTTGSARLTLLLMHLSVAAALIPVLRGTTRAAGRTP